MSDEMQFDATLGGSQDLPTRVNLLSFTSDRVKEIKAMKQALQQSTGTKLAFQRLPKHMRRRAMSHNAKRLPRRLREIHLNQLKKSGMPPQQKRPSRKHRRRPRNLLADHARRRRKHVWLETHIWHAKRFHMVEKWGYRLADRPCDKAFRACYRAASKHCLLQDLSYFSCVEISGPQEILVQNLKKLCDSNVNLSVGAKAFVRGNREGQVELFNCNGATKRAIGTIYFHWKPENQPLIDVRSIWLWVHAAFYSETLITLKELFNLTNDSTETYTNKTLRVKLTELKDRLNRFRLTGPLSLSVLYNTLKLATAETTNSSWFGNYLKTAVNIDAFTKQCEYWESIRNCSSSAELSPSIILSLIVKDPRFNMPSTRTKAIMEWKDVRCMELPENAALGPLWDEDVRTAVKSSKISNAKLCELRSQLLVPGTELEGPAEAIPVILIQRPGNRNKNLSDYNSGWDLILPSGWGNAFWLSLIMWGARAGGLREFDSVRFESGLPNFLAPDTQAGKEEECKVTEAHQQKFFRLPPNKRPNYTKLGIIQPFCYNWKILVQDWRPNTVPVDDFFVLRNRRMLAEIQDSLLGRIKPKSLDYNMNCILPVRIRLDHKGTAKQFARICLAEPMDLLPNKAPTEPIQEDQHQQIRKQLRDTHKNLLKKLRRKRIKAKKEGNAIQSDVEILKKYNEQMRELWLPAIDKDIRTSCSRQVIGFVTSGNFSFTQAHSCAVGYIAMGSIRTMISKQQNVILVRNISSRKYRTGTLDIVV